jgi:hypothetical protein
MKRIIVCAILLITVATGLTKSQTPADEMSHVLEKLFGRLRTLTADSVRLRINDSIKTQVEKYVTSDRVFVRTFPNLRYLGQITSSDSLIKIITWNLLLKDEPGRYFCYFIRKSSDGSANKVYPLTASYDNKQIEADTVYTQSDWYGALYYDIRPFMAENGKCWVALGINYPDRMMTRKLIDVVSFTADDKIVFGKKWFDSAGSVSFRHILEYSASAVISLRFMPDNSIVFDHLVPLPPEVGDGRLYNGPDYSYDAFIFEDGLWKLSINVDARNRQK